MIGDVSIGSNIGMRWEEMMPSKPRVWLIRAQNGSWTETFVKNGYIGIHYNLDAVDMSDVKTIDEIRDIYVQQHPNQTKPRTIGNHVGQIRRFLLVIKAGDIVLTPGADDDEIRFGHFTGGATYYTDGSDRLPCRNRKDVNWSKRKLSRGQLPSRMVVNSSTVSEIRDATKKSKFFKLINPNPPPPPGPVNYTIDDMIDDDDLFFEPDELRRMHRRFEDKKNLILQGPPGVGKTFVLKRLAYALMGERTDDRMENVQFHQSYSYDEFVQGYRPNTNNERQLIFELQDGVFLGLCDVAQDNPDDRYVMVIDEINRGNLSRVFGELLSLIEKDKRGDSFQIRLAGGNEFFVPENVYILGTMNLADRSLAGMDYAMRRRFAFVTLKPQFGQAEFVSWLQRKGMPDGMIEQINERMENLNDEITRDPSLGRNFAVGHSYFCDIYGGAEEWQEPEWNGWYREIVETEIQPLLEEYWFDDLTKAEAQVGELLDGVA